MGITPNTAAHFRGGQNWVCSQTAGGGLWRAEQENRVYSQHGVTLEKIASCRYKTKMDKRSGFWQVDLTPNTQELLAFITPQGRVFNWKVMPFGVAIALALCQELMNKILSILRWRPVVQALISQGAQIEAHIDNVCLGTNTQEDHLILLGEFFAVCQENHTRLKLEKWEFMQDTMQ